MRALALLLCLLSAQAWATTYWVTASGAGTTDGSSLANACSFPSDTSCFSSANVPLATAGDTMCFSGTFTGFVINPNQDGTALSPVKYIFDGSGVCAGATAATMSRSAGTQMFQIDQDYQTIIGGTWNNVQSGTTSKIFSIVAGADGTVFDGVTVTGAIGGANYWGILSDLADGATSVNGITVVNSTFTGFVNSGYETIRLVPRSTSAACTAGVGKFQNVSVTYSTFTNNVTAMRAVPLATGASIADCLPSRAQGFVFDHNAVDGTVSQGVNFTCQTGARCSVSYNVFRNNGDGTSDTYNVIQANKMDDGIIEGNEIYGVNDAGGAGDGAGVMVDHVGNDRNYQGDNVTVRGNFITGADSNTSACGIDIWSADNVKAHGNIVMDSYHGICVSNSDVTGAKIDHNTVVNSLTANFKFAINVAASEMEDNISYGAPYAVKVESGSTAPTDGYNDFFGYTTAQVSGTYTPAGSTLDVDPDFADGDSPTSAAGFCLTPGSPLLAAGTYIGAWATGYGGEDLGKPPAIGARGTCYGRPLVTSRPAVTSRPSN